MFYKDNILEQFQTHQAESGNDDNYSDDETVNNVAPEWHSRLVVESAPDVLKNAALYSKTEDEMQSFLLRFQKFTFKKKIVCLRANEHNWIFQ